MSDTLNREQVREASFATAKPIFPGLAFLLPYSSLDLPTFCLASSKRYPEYSQYRRFVKSRSRLNYLQYIGFGFGRCSAITLTISSAYINDKKSIRYALNRFESMLRRKDIDKYIIAKEEGELHRREHFHAILFDAPFIPVSYQIAREYALVHRLHLSERALRDNLDDIWRIGQDIKIKEIKNIRGGVFYLASYIKKGFYLQWSRGFFKESLLRNDVYYTLDYDKTTGIITPDKVFGAYITKSDYFFFKSHIPSALLARLAPHDLLDEFSKLLLNMSIRERERLDYMKERSEFLEFKHKEV